MKNPTHFRIQFLAALALFGMMAGCSNNLAVAPKIPAPVPTNTPALTLTPAGTPASPLPTNTFTGSPTPINTPTRSFTPAPTFTGTITCTITPVSCGAPLPVVYPYGWGAPVYEQESSCGSGTNDNCATAQNVGGACTAGLYVLGYLSSVGSGSYAGSDQDFYAYTEGCAGTWHVMLDCTNGNNYQLIVDPCGASPATFNSGYSVSNGGGGAPVTVEVVSSSGAPGPYRLCIWREGLPTPSPTITFTSTYTPTFAIDPGTPTKTSTAAPTGTFTMTATPTLTSSPTPTGTWYTSTPTNTPTITDTPTWTGTPTNTFTFTITPTPTDTFTPNATATACNAFTFGNIVQEPGFGGAYNIGLLIRYQAPQGMTLYTMNAYLEAIVSNAQYITAIYSDDGTGAAPVSLLAQTSPQVLGPAAWYSAPLLTPLHVTGGTYYWLGVLMDGWIGTSSTGTNSIAYSYDWDPAGSGFNWNNPPAKIPNIYGLDVNPNQSLSFSIYASGCPDNLITYTPTPTSVCAPLTCTPSITSTPTNTPTPTVTFTVTSTPT